MTLTIRQVLLVRSGVTPRGLLLAAAALLLATPLFAYAQSVPTPNPLRAEPTDGLSTQQSRLADRFSRLEMLAARLAELSRSTQPRRARVLRDLIARSREEDVTGNFDEIIAALNSDQLGRATDVQVDLQADLKKLLELLQQEDREKQIQSERKRIRKYLSELKRLIQLQRGVKARTDGGDDRQPLTDDQRRLAEATKSLDDEIQSNELSEASDSNSESSGTNRDENNKVSDPENSSDESSIDQQPPPANGNQQDSPSQSSDNPGAEKQPSEGSSPSRNNDGNEPTPSESSPSQESPSDGDQQSTDSPPPSQDSGGRPIAQAQQRLRQARQRMQQAIERLKEAQRKEAVQEQEQALRELEQAKAELERILRQLREEELERMLVLLEARFRKMLALQVEVYDETKQLDSSRNTVAVHEIEIASGRLSRKEREIAGEAERALVLLREDGTTVAFPEALEQARDDMQDVQGRLSAAKVGVITQGIEEDIIAALEETIAALQQAIKESRERKSQPQQPGSGSPHEQPLVDQLQELRMIRALQNRINRRTKRYGDILGDDPATEQDLIEALAELAIRQERVFRATRDLDTGRNQ